jgi:hypothetical protein
MATEQIPSPVQAHTPPPQPRAQPAPAWLARLGLSGKILAIGGLVGIISVWLPLVSIHMQAPANPLGARGGVSVPGFSMSQTIMVARDFRGMICLAGYIAALALIFVLYRPNGLGQKSLCWAAAGVGALITLMALWLVLGTLSGSGSLGGFGGGLSISLGIGAILNLLAAVAVAAGGVLKAREERLF